MFKWTGRRLLPGIDMIADRPALHEDDGVVTILARYSGGQTRHKSCLDPARHLLKTVGRQMVAFIDNKMAIICYAVVHDAFTHQALDKRDINQASGFVPSA